MSAKETAPRKQGQNIKVSTATHRRLKIKAAKRGKTIGELVDLFDKHDDSCKEPKK